MMCPVVPGERPSAGLLFLRAFFGLSQNDICLVVDTSSSAGDYDIAPLGRNKCMGGVAVFYWVLLSASVLLERWL